MTRLYTFLLALLLVIGVTRPIGPTNQDVWRHLLLGDLILQTKHVPLTNLLSYTYPEYPFINSHWLSEVIFAFLYHVTGPAGLIVLATGLILTSCILLFLLAKKHFGLPLVLFTGTISSILLLERTDVRPELFSFLLLSLFLTLLYRYKTKPTRLIYALIPLELVWVNLHIYFFVGIAVLLFFLVELRTKKLAIVTTLAALVTLLNPNGLQGALLPFTVLQSYGMPVAENQNIFFLQSLYHQPRILLFELTAGFLALTMLFRRDHTALADRLLFVFFGVLTILHLRNLPLFVYGTFFLFVSALSYVYEKENQTFKRVLTKRTFAFLRFYILSLGFLVLVFTIVRFVLFQPPGLSAIESNKGAVDFFINNRLSGPIYNNFDMGSYLAYRLYPREKVFVDGRPEAYPKAFFEDVYFPMQKDPAVFAKISKQYGFQTIILTHWDQTPAKDPFLITLLKNKEYKLVYLDDYSLVMVKDAKKLTILTEKTFTLPKNIDRPTLQRYRDLFEKIGWNTLH